MVSRWLAEVGSPLSGILADSRGLPVVDIRLTFASALRLDDRVWGTLWLERASARSAAFRIEFAAAPGGPPAVTVLFTQVHTKNQDGKPRAVPVPQDRRQALAGAPTVDIPSTFEWPDAP